MNNNDLQRLLVGFAEVGVFVWAAKLLSVPPIISTALLLLPMILRSLDIDKYVIDKIDNMLSTNQIAAR